MTNAGFSISKGGGQRGDPPPRPICELWEDVGKLQNLGVDADKYLMGGDGQVVAVKKARASAKSINTHSILFINRPALWKHRWREWVRGKRGRSGNGLPLLLKTQACPRFWGGVL